MLGSSGLLGRYLCSSFADEGYSVIKASKSDSSSDHLIDASVFGTLKQLLEKVKPEIVVNAIKPKMSTDQAEEQKDITWSSNVSVAHNLAKLQKQSGFYLVHLSSDWVYEGAAGVTYTEESFTYPQNFYSYTKAVAEERIRSLCEDYVILRTTGLFGMESRRSNFFMRLMDAVNAGKDINAPSDQFSHPIYAGELSRLIVLGVKKHLAGTFNAVGNEYISRYELAKIFCDAMGWDKKHITPVASPSFRKIRVPSHLDVSNLKLKKALGEINPLERQLEMLKKEL